MPNNIRQAIALLIPLLILGPIAARLAEGILLDDGAPGGIILAARHVPAALLSSIAIIALAAAAAAIAAPLRGPRHALVAAGLVFAWAAWAVPATDELLRRTRDPNIINLIAIDAAILSLLAITAIALALRLSRPVPHREQDIATSFRAFLASLKSTTAITAIAAATIVGIVAATLVARSPLDGQTLAAAIAAGLAGGALARILAFQATLAPLLIAAALITIAAPLATILLVGTSPETVARGLAANLPAISWLTPWNALAGLCIGLPLGINWAAEISAKQLAKADNPDPKPKVRVKRAT